MPELKFTNKNSLTSGKVLIGNFKGYIFPWEKSISCRPLFISFNHLFVGPKPMLSHYADK